MKRTHLTSMIASALLAFSLGCGVAQPGDEPGNDTAEQPPVAQRTSALDDIGGGAWIWIRRRRGTSRTSPWPR
jgi:hypothetical protein